MQDNRSADGDASDERMPLTEGPKVEQPSKGWEDTTWLKYGSLGLVIVQNSSHVLLLRYSRVAGGACEGYVVRSVPCALRLCPSAARHRRRQQPRALLRSGSRRPVA